VTAHFAKGLGYHTQSSRTGRLLYSITGLHAAEILELCELIGAAVNDSDRTWPPSLGLYASVVITLAYQRGNRTEAELAETYQTSQSSVSRVIAAITPLQERALRPFVPTAEELKPGTQYLVDGTLLPCWSWADHPELYSGKHHTTGLNVQVVGSLDGELAWISDPVDGSRHDVYCLDESGALLTLDPGDWTGDKGYLGRGILTPYKKPPNSQLLDWQKTFNSALNTTRAVIEQLISHLKNWKILHTDYRRPLNTFPTTISAVVGLHFWLNG
jgi:hypothetical protein